MSTTTDFIAELARAAHEAGKLTADERGRLIMRGARDQGDAASKQAYAGARQRVERSGGGGADEIQDGSNDGAKTVLLEVADMILALKVVLDVKAGDE